MAYTIEEFAELDIDELFSREKVCAQCLEAVRKCECQNYDFIDHNPICNPTWPTK